MSLLRLHQAVMAGQAAPAGNYWNPADKTSLILLSNGNATATRDTPSPTAFNAVRGITSHNSGKWYAECLNVVDVPGSMIFGVGTSGASLSTFPGGGTPLGSSWGVQANNNTRRATYYNGLQTNQGGTSGISAGGLGILAVDFDAGRIWFGDSAFGFYTGNPSAGTTPTYTFTAGTTLFLMLGMASSPQQCTLRNQVGENTGTIPTGFSMWG